MENTQILPSSTATEMCNTAASTSNATTLTVCCVWDLKASAARLRNDRFSLSPSFPSFGEFTCTSYPRYKGFNTDNAPQNKSTYNF